MIEVQRATADLKGSARLDEIRASLNAEKGSGDGRAAASAPARRALRGRRAGAADGSAARRPRQRPMHGLTPSAGPVRCSGWQVGHQ